MSENHPVAVDPALLEPIPDVPDEMNRFLVALASVPHGIIELAASTVGRSLDSVAYWRKKNVEFGERVKLIHDLRRAELAGKAKQLYYDIVLQGSTEVSEQTLADGRKISSRKVSKEAKSLLALLERLQPEEFALERDRNPLAGGAAPITFVFKLSDRDGPEVVEGEVTSEVDDTSGFLALNE